MFDIKRLYEPKTVDEAIALLVEHPQARIMAGGSDNLVKLRDGKMGGQEWVTIYGLPELGTIELDADGALRIGSGCTFTKVARHELVKRHLFSLTEALATIAGPQIRNVGTIGGNVSNGAPSADSAIACVAWDATLELKGPEGVRTLPIRDYYLDAMKVDLRPGEILTTIVFPREAYEGYFGSHFKYAMRGAMDIATVNCSTTIKLDADGTIADARIAFGVAAPTPIRAMSGEDALRGHPATQETVDAAAHAAIADTKARNSWRAAKDFREHMLAEMARRCLSTAILRAQGAATNGDTK